MPSLEGLLLVAHIQGLVVNEPLLAFMTGVPARAGQAEQGTGSALCCILVGAFHASEAGECALTTAQRNAFLIALAYSIGKYLIFPAGAEG